MRFFSRKLRFPKSDPKREKELKELSNANLKAMLERNLNKLPVTQNPLQPRSRSRSRNRTRSRSRSRSRSHSVGRSIPKSRNQNNVIDKKIRIVRNAPRPWNKTRRNELKQRNPTAYSEQQARLNRENP